MEGREASRGTLGTALVLVVDNHGCRRQFSTKNGAANVSAVVYEQFKRRTKGHTTDGCLFVVFPKGQSLILPHFLALVA